MQVIKRNGYKQEVSFDKVKLRISSKCEDLNTVDPIIIAQQVISRIYNEVKTSDLDELTCLLYTSDAADE